MAEQVTVACKIPMGLHMDLVADPAKLKDRKPEDPPLETRRVTLNGGNSADAVVGYGMTVVDKDFWDAWAKQNANNPLLTNHEIWALPRPDSAAAKAKEETKDVKTGLEPIAQENDPRAAGLNVKPVDKKDI